MSVLTVGGGKEFTTFAAAVAAAKDGDVIAVQAGTYTNDFATIAKKLTVVGVDGMASFVATGPIPNGKAIFITRSDVVLQNIEFSGATVSAGNGAGIRYEGGSLSVRDCFFHDNENGILAGAISGGLIDISGSEFARNGRGDGQTHGIYIGSIESLTVRDSYFHDTNAGHHIKSRAAHTTVENSRLDDGVAGTASYNIDLPNGGVGVIRGNTIIQSATTQNAALLHFGYDPLHATSDLLVANNIIENFRAGATGVLNHTTIPVQVVDNQIYNVPTLIKGPGTQSGNATLADAPPRDTGSPWLNQAGVAITGSADSEVLLGRAGNDVVEGGAGADILIGGGGADAFVVNAGNGSDQIADFGATDKVVLDGYAFADFAGVKAALTQSAAGVLLALGNGESLSFAGRKIADFTAGHFELVNVPATQVEVFDLPRSGATKYTKYGTSGADVLVGTSANDLIDGGRGKDTLSGGRGDDTYFVSGEGDTVVEKPGEGIDTVHNWSLSYVLADNVENLIQRVAIGVVTGNALDNRMLGTKYKDTIDGGAGRDLVEGGGGGDILTGGSGSDIFVYRSVGDAGDVIKDFKSGTDLLDLRALMSQLQVASDPVADGFLKIAASGAHSIVTVDVDAAGPAAPVTLVTVENVELKPSDYLWI